jgi:subtilisin family serine protease
MKKRNQLPKKNITTKSGYDVEKKPIFGDKVSDIVPGEVILQLDETGAASVGASIPRGPTRGRREFGAGVFGISALDHVLAKLKVTSVVAIHPPAPVVSAAMAEAVSMASTYRVSFEKSTSVETAVKQLSEVAGVEYVEPNRYRETCAVPNDPSYPSQWGLAKINCPAAWDRTTGSPSITVAVIDTGVDLDHPELAPLIVAGTDMVDLGPNPTPPAGFRFEGDFQGRDNNPQDEVGHGTHVAGTIACLSNNGVGVAGVTWSCHIMPVRVLARIVNISNPADVRGTGSSADIAAGIRWAVDNGARVMNLSLGGPSDTQVERDAIAYAIAHGVVVVAAMGNSYQQGNPTSYPGAYPNVVAVGAIDQSDHRAAFSQTGPHIDISGPGVGVLSTVWNNGYTTMSGTSMATPHVAGVAALVLSCNPSLTGAQVADILRQTARPLRDNPTDPIPNNNYGFGCVDAQAAVNRGCPPRPTTLITCRVSRIVLCPTQTITCRATSPVTCRATTPVTCRVSTVILCRTTTITCQVTQPITCRPSVAIPCPTGPVCPGPGPGPGPGPVENPGLAQQGSWDPGYDPYGWGGEDLGSYDPYAGYYGEEGCGCQG